MSACASNGGTSDVAFGGRGTINCSLPGFRFELSVAGLNILPPRK